MGKHKEKEVKPLNIPTEPIDIIIEDEPKYNKEQMRSEFIFWIDPYIVSFSNRPSVLKEIFEVFDVEKTGLCPLTIIPMTLSTLGVKMKEEEMEKLIKEVDANGSGTIDFQEYIALAQRYIEPEDDYNKLYSELRQVFMIFDKEREFHV